jgi:CRP-like cAMP-binding protein
VIDAEMQRQPELACNALRILGERLRQLEEDHALLATRKLEDRLALVLLRLAQRYGRPTEQGTELGLTREELAQIAGTNLFSVSRQLSHWEAKGIVRSRREVVVLCEPARLAEVASDAAALACVV